MTLDHRPNPRAARARFAGVGLAASAGLAYCLAGCLACGAAAAQGLPEGGHGIVTMTRGMRIFGDAERKVIAALKAHDKAALDRLVADDFEQRSQPAPGEPLARDEWTREAPAAAAQSAGLRQMAVHDLGDTAVVSFQWLHPAPDFVVDVWRKKAGSDDWQLAIRYLSAAPAAASAAPTAAPSMAGHASPPAPASTSGPVDPKR